MALSLLSQSVTIEASEAMTVTILKTLESSVSNVSLGGVAVVDLKWVCHVQLVTTYSFILLKCCYFHSFIHQFVFVGFFFFIN